MRPHPASIMAGAAARAIRNGPTTFVSITVRQVVRRDGPEPRRHGPKRIADSFHPPPGVVDQNVEPAEAIERRLDEPHAIVLARHVRNQRNDAPLAEPPFGLLRHGVDFGLFPRGRCDHASAGFRQRERHGAADAAPAPGDDGDARTKGHGSLRLRSGGRGRREEIFDTVERIDREAVEEPQKLRSGLPYPMFGHAGNEHGGPCLDPEFPAVQRDEA